MPIVYYEQDANLAALAGCRIAVIGYGNLGRPFAQNLRDSGQTVMIGNIDDDYGLQAHRDGFDVLDIAETAQKATIKLLLLPDEIMPEVYLNAISPTLRPGDTLLFASGYNIAFGFIEPPPFVDVVMVAPRTVGAGVREGVLSGQGYMSFIAVGQDATGKAWDRLMALALALGTLRAGAIEVTFQQEAELDLFMEQSFVPAFHHLLMAAADLLIKEGYPPEAVLLDLYGAGKLSYTLDKAAQRGLGNILQLYPMMTQYGMLSRAERYQDARLIRQMELTLEDIRTGKFAQEWAAEYANGYPRLESLRRRRKMMTFWALEEQALAMLRQPPPGIDMRRAMQTDNLRRIVLIKPCCIGDVILATPLLTALKRGYSNAAVDWVVGSMAIDALREHPDLHRVIDSGPLSNPASRPGSLARLVSRLREGGYELAVVPERSPLIGLAPLLAGIPRRAGLDSAGRGFSYTIKAPIQPDVIRHEADIYLDVARALGLDTADCWANVPPSQMALETARNVLKQTRYQPDQPLIVVHPGGGVNAGMTLIEKRWPAANFAALADRVADAIGGQIAVIGVKSDQSAVDIFRQALKHPVLDLTGRLSLAATGALASLAAIYLGNDNGVAHLAAASGGKVLMIFGPSDPRRYAPYVPPERARIVWRPVDLPERGVSAGAPASFEWEHDGATVDDAWCEAQKLLGLTGE